MSISHINTLTSGSINGLNSLSLDELITTKINSDSIDAAQIYYQQIEGNEIIVDTRLTLTNTGVISVGNFEISDIELTYLDGVSSNIQTQINNIVSQENNYQSQIDTHTTQITALQAKDVIHTNKIVVLEDEFTDLYTSDAVMSTQLAVLSDKTMFQTRNSIATIFSNQINILNGNIGFYNSLLPNNFYIQSNLASGNNLVLNSGLANIYLQSQNVYLGKPDATSGRKSNLLFYNASGYEYEVQSSAFTENLKDVLINDAYSNMQQDIAITALQTSDTTQNTTISLHTTQINELYDLGTVLNDVNAIQNTNITDLQSKTQNITSANTTSTNMNKPLRITTNGECLRTIGNHTFWSGFDTANTTRHFAIGKEGVSSNKLMVSNYTLGETVIQAGSRTGNTNLGQNKIFTYSNGISLRRGGITLNDNLITVGEIGGLNTDAHFYINGNATNNIIVDSGIGSITLKSNTINVGNGNDNVIIKSAGTSGLLLQSTNVTQIDTKILYMGSTTALNGKYTTLALFNSTGTDWEYQNSAFTEVLKAEISTTTSKFTNTRVFGGNKGKITMVRAFEIIGRPPGTSTLVANTLYNSSTNYNVGQNLQSLYPNLFMTDGSFFSEEGDMNFSLTFEFAFLCKNSSIRQLKTYIQVQNSGGVTVENSFTQGIHYRTAQTFNEIVYYNVGPLKHIITQGQKLFISTTYDFTTGSEGALTSMNTRFTIERNPL